MDVVVHVDQTRSRNRGEINRITLNFRRYSALIKELTGKQFARRGNKRRNTKGYKGFAFWDDYFETWIALLKTRLISSFPESSRTRIRKPPFRLLFRTVKKKKIYFRRRNISLTRKILLSNAKLPSKGIKSFLEERYFCRLVSRIQEGQEEEKEKRRREIKERDGEEIFFLWIGIFLFPSQKKSPKITWRC